MQPGGHPNRPACQFSSDQNAMDPPGVLSPNRPLQREPVRRLVLILWFAEMRVSDRNRYANERSKT